MILNKIQRQEIIDKYLGLYTSKQLTEEYGVSSVTIMNIVSGRKFPDLNRPENIKEICKRKKQDGSYVCIDHIQPSQKQIEIINGSMLGDGWAIKGSFYKKQCVDSKEHIVWIYENLLPFSAGIWDNYSKGKIYHKNKIPMTKKVDEYQAAYTIYTHTHEYFKKLIKLWYPEGKKIVPRNLELTPLTLAIWAADDGSNCVKKRVFILCTNGFSFEDVEFLKEKLFLTFEIKSSIEKSRNQPVMIIQGSSYDKFIELITPHFPWICFSKKIKRRKMLRSHTDKLNDDKVKKIIDFWNSGETIIKISEEMKLKRGTIHRILSGQTYKHLSHLIFVLASRESAMSRNCKTRVYKTKLLKCIETDKIYKSAKEAALENNISRNLIYKSINQKQSVQGFHWKYISD